MPSKCKANKIANLDTRNIKKWTARELASWNGAQQHNDFEVVQCPECDAKMQQKNYNNHYFTQHGGKAGDVIKQNKFNITTLECVQVKKATKRRRKDKDIQLEARKERAKQRKLSDFFQVKQSIYLSQTKNK